MVSDAEKRSADEGSGGGGGKMWFIEGSNPAKSSKAPDEGIGGELSVDVRDMNDEHDDGAHMFGK